MIKTNRTNRKTVNRKLVALVMAVAMAIIGVSLPFAQASFPYGYSFSTQYSGSGAYDFFDDGASTTMNVTTSGNQWFVAWRTTTSAVSYDLDKYITFDLDNQNAQEGWVYLTKDATTGGDPIGYCPYIKWSVVTVGGTTYSKISEINQYMGYQELWSSTDSQYAHGTWGVYITGFQDWYYCGDLANPSTLKDRWDPGEYESNFAYLVTQGNAWTNYEFFFIPYGSSTAETLRDFNGFQAWSWQYQLRGSSIGDMFWTNYLNGAVHISYGMSVYGSSVNVNVFSNFQAGTM